MRFNTPLKKSKSPISHNSSANEIRRWWDAQEPHVQQTLLNSPNHILEDEKGGDYAFRQFIKNLAGRSKLYGKPAEEYRASLNTKNA